MLYKFIGSGLIIFASSFLGISRAEKFNARVKYLQSMQSSILRIENEIRYAHTPLTEIFKRTCESDDGVVGKMFLSAYNCMRELNGKPLSQIWASSVEKVSGKIFKDDKELLCSFSKCFTKGDVESQIKSLRLYFERISHTLEKAQRESEINKKLFTNLGVYTGILVAVLLI